MARPRNTSREALVPNAMHVFWRHGFAGTSISDLVSATKLTREALYQAHPGKEALFTACLDQYRLDVVDPAIAAVRTLPETRDPLQHYFDFQIDRAVALGLPGPGCLIANTSCEPIAAKDEVAERVTAHVERLQALFVGALKAFASDEVPKSRIVRVSRTLAIATQGFWTWSRTIGDERVLRREARNLVALAKAGLVA